MAIQTRIENTIHDLAVRAGRTSTCTPRHGDQQTAVSFVCLLGRALQRATVPLRVEANCEPFGNLNGRAKSSDCARTVSRALAGEPLWRLVIESDQPVRGGIILARCRPFLSADREHSNGRRAEARVFVDVASACRRHRAQSRICRRSRDTPTRCGRCDSGTAQRMLVLRQIHRARCGCRTRDSAMPYGLSFNLDKIATTDKASEVLGRRRRGVCCTVPPARCGSLSRAR
jgi:hypothetical protein